MSSSNNQIKKYNTYTREARIQLIKLVDQQNFSTAQAARLLGIKQTSACRIMKSFHNHNTIFQKRADKEQRQKNVLGFSSSMKEQFLMVQPCAKTLKSQKQKEVCEEGATNPQSLNSISGVMANSADYFTVEYNSVIANSFLGFPFGYYQMYVANNSFGYLDCIQ